MVKCDVPAHEFVVRQRVTGAERARTDHATGFDQLGCGEDVLRPHGVVETGGHPVCQVDTRLVISKGPIPPMLPVVMCMHVDEAGNDRTSRGIDDPIDTIRGTCPDATDASVLDHDRTFLYHFVGLIRCHGDDPRIRERDTARNLSTRNVQGDVDRVRSFCCHIVAVIPGRASELQIFGAPPAHE